jgi:polysaccharide export outer membrane protein
MRLNNLVTVLVIILGFNACRPVSEVAYFQPDEKKGKPSRRNAASTAPSTPISFEYHIRPGDILAIYVSSLSPEASSFFNTIAPIERNEQGGASSYSTRTDIGYLVDAAGTIVLPLVGKVAISGLSTSQARDTLTVRLEKFLQAPSVRMYIQNFRITILGEVNRPGVFNVTNEKISIPEAMGMAGDLNIFADRKGITLIRDTGNAKMYFPIDLTQRNLFTSPQYQLQSGDILYVPPVQGRVAQSDNFYRVAPMILSAITLIAVIATRVSNSF